LWGVVPDAPRYKKDLKPGLIRGSAVAVSDGTLLASCRVAGGRQRIGLVRHNKYEIARVRAADPERSVCVLEVADDCAAAEPGTGFRSLADLRVGEPVYAVVSRTSAEFAVAEGRVTGKPGAAGTGALETSLVLPAGARSAVLVDALGTLIGLGSGSAKGGAATVAAVPTRAVTRLANRDLGEDGAVRLAALPSPARVTASDGRAPVLILFRDEPDRDDGDRPTAVAATAEAEASRAAPVPADADDAEAGAVGGDPRGAGDGRGRVGEGGRDERGRDGGRSGRGGGFGDGLGGSGDRGGGLGHGGSDRDDRGGRDGRGGGGDRGDDRDDDRGGRDRGDGGDDGDDD
jgi:hypothetical protein